MRKLVFCTLAALFVLFVPGTATAAGDYPPALNLRHAYLDPTPPANAATAWVVRDIELVDGTYRWEVLYRPDGLATYVVATRDIYLADATYRWRCYVDPGADYEYRLGCILDGPSGSAGVEAPPQLMLAGNNNFTWGGRLTRL